MTRSEEGARGALGARGQVPRGPGAGARGGRGCGGAGLAADDRRGPAPRWVLLEKTGDYAEAEAASLSAYMAAAKVRAWDVAASAAIQLAYTVGYKQARHAEGKVWAAHAEVAVSFAGDPLGLREAARLNNLALVHSAAGAYAEAKAC